MNKMDKNHCLHSSPGRETINKIRKLYYLLGAEMYDE